MAGNADGKEGMARGRGRPRAGEAPDPAHVERVALLAFAAHGYEGASLRDIAASAGVDPALVSRRYGSKLGLWQAMVDGLAAQLGAVYAAMHAELAGDGPFQDRFRAALRLFVAFNCDVPQISHFFISELQHEGDRREFIVAHIWQPYLAMMRPLIRQASDERIIRPADPAFAPVSLLGIVVMPQLVAPVLRRELDLAPRDAVDRIMASIDGLLTGA
jgi:AcrR family transcriptional regulator